MTENHFRSHFSPFQINTQLFFTKWLPAAILDDRKSLSIAFLAISHQYTTLFFHKLTAVGHFGRPKITFDHISRYFRLICNLFFEFFLKLATGSHFGSPIWAILDNRKSLSIAFLAISDQYITFFCFQIFFKMAAGGHFGSPICAKNNRVLPLCVINGYAKYEVDR